jgi:predicted GIY-YIG superfamily endonuclease
VPYYTQLSIRIDNSLKSAYLLYLDIHRLGGWIVAETPSMTWYGVSGKAYKYFIFPIGTAFKTVPGNYIFCKETVPGTWYPIYIGETDDLSTRFDNHEKLPCIRKYKGTHIQTHESSPSKSVRMEEEQDIIKKYDPDCNKE